MADVGNWTGEASVKTRRATFVRIAVTLVAAAALALVVAVAASPEPRSEAKYGGTLVVGLRGEPDSLDPSLSFLFQAVVVYRTFCEKLYDLDDKAQPAPQLAAALPVVSKDKLTYTIRLRRGIVFNDGTPFNAQAVVTTLERNRTLSGSSRASDLEAVESVTAPGADTVVIHLKSRFTPLTDKLTTAAAAIMSPAQLEKLGERFATNPICVGPFMYDGRVAGDSITVIKSPYYYNKKAVYLDKIVFKITSDAPAASAALKAGDLQVIDDVSTTEVEGLQQASGLRVVQRNTFGFHDIRVNVGNKNGTLNLPYTKVDTPLGSNAKLRKAFEEAIDRRALGRVVFGGRVQPGCTPVSPASTWYDASVGCTPHDPANAKRLVAASGVRDPTVHLLTPTFTETLLLAQVIQAQEAAVGITVVIDPVSNTTIVARGQSGNYDAILSGWAGRSEPDHNIYNFLATSGSRNVTGYSNPRLDLILANGRKATSRQARATLYRSAQRLILDDRPVIYLYHPIKFAAFSTQVTGVEFGSDLALRVAFAQFR